MEIFKQGFLYDDSVLIDCFTCYEYTYSVLIFFPLFNSFCIFFSLFFFTRYASDKDREVEFEYKIHNIMYYLKSKDNSRCVCGNGMPRFMVNYILQYA